MSNIKVQLMDSQEAERASRGLIYQIQAQVALAHTFHTGGNWPDELCKLCAEEVQEAREDHIRMDEIHALQAEETEEA